MPMVVTQSPIRPFIYSDVNTQFESDNLSLILLDVEAINNQILNLFGTEIGTRIFEPEFGSLIEQYIFDPVDEVTAYLIHIEMQTALKKWMSTRVLIDTQQTTITPLDSLRGYDVVLAYSLVGLGVNASLQFNLRGVV